MRGKRSDRGIIVRIDVEDAGSWINGRPAPLSASFKARRHNGIFANTERDKLPIMSYLA